MSLSDIYVQLSQFGHKVEILGDINNEYATLKIDGYYIENRIEDGGFRITGKSVFLSVYNSQEVLDFFIPKQLKKEEL